MPYYCTVPRCTSMAGKVKNVSFHQFPRDEELAKLWNKILKRGKPYTKYSKVCSLHFTPEDYTITNAGKYKGQWRTLRKDAVPSRNLPSETPTPYHRRELSSWSPTTNTVDPRLHQQMAQAIYVQTMLAMQAAGVADVGSNMFTNDQPMPSPGTESSNSSNPSPQNNFTYDPIDVGYQQRDNHPDDIDIASTDQIDNASTEHIEHKDEGTKELNVTNTDFVNKVTYKCNDCSKCFKDPDVFLLHKRIHSKGVVKSDGNENVQVNGLDTQETLKANPILANLLKSGVSQGSVLSPGDLEVRRAFENNVVSIESQIMAALAANMENYLRNLSTIMTNSTLVDRVNGNSIQEDNVDDSQDDDKVDDKYDEIDDETGPNLDEFVDENNHCDSEDFETQDSDKLVIDEHK